MARFVRFSDKFLDDLREEVDLPALVAEEIKLRRSGGNFVARCPFHEEKSPSFHVSATRNTFRCYGCPARGDAIEWVMRRQHKSFHEAVLYLAHRFGIELPQAEEESPDDQQRRKRLARLYQALNEVGRVYVRGLKKNPAGLRYLVDTRGFTESSVELFGIGAVASGVLPFLKGFSDQELIDAGIAAVDSAGERVYDRFRNRIMFPIHNESGNLVGFAGRTILENPGKAPKYLNCPETDLFHKGRELYGLHIAKTAIRKDRLAVVGEGYFDVIRAHQEGDPRVVAPMGTALTAVQMKRLLLHADTVVFAFDGDRAGRRAALSAAAILLETMKDGQTGKFLFLPAGHDPDSFIRAEGIQAWLDQVESAVPLSQFLSDYVVHRLDRSLPESQVNAAARASAILSRLQKALVFRHALRLRFEELIGVPLG
ncbi:DNA primase [Stutzerimonas frequens]|uniref:DNA primase n=1 Tax=Stutzerimonas frequens TaxID=2968969 RepID=UPI001AAE7209|nr:DNA primase [Stutzerimonas frequens]QTF59148.1 DNA primase [Stutzerimonas frequens]